MTGPTPPASSSSFQHQQQHNSNHHDRQSLSLPTQFRSSSANRGHTNEEDEEADHPADAETEKRASASAAGSRHDDHPNSSTSIGHRGHYPLWTWCKNNLILLSFIAMTLSTLGLVYKNRQLQNQNEALENELRWTLSARLDALPSASKVKEEHKRKGKTPKVECASSVEPSVSIE